MLSIFALLPIVSILLCSTAIGQQRDNASATLQREIDTWVNFSVGTGIFDEDEGLATMLSVFHQREQHLFSIRGLFIQSNDPGFLRVSDFANDIALMYGRSTNTSWGRASLSSGLAYTSFDFFDSPTIGLLQGQMNMFPPNFSVIGLSLGFFANINLRKPFAGFIVGISLGDV
jgi:hypothetical protein